MSADFPASERCVICNGLLADADDHVALGRVTDDHSDPLHAQNHAHFHRTCLAVWPKLASLIDDLEALANEQEDERMRQKVVDLVTLRRSAA